MRILFLASDFPSPLHPTKGVFNLALMRALANAHDLRVINPISWLDERPANHPIERFRQTAQLQIWHPRYVYPPKLMRNHYDWFYGRSVRRAVKQATQDWHPDAVLGYWAHPDGAVAARLATSMRVPSAVIVGGSDVLLITRDRARRKAVTRALQNVDAVISVNQHLKQKVTELGIPAGKVRVWSQGVDQSIFFPGDMSAARGKLSIASQCKVLICVARLVPVKGIDVLLDACARINVKEEPFHLYLLGDGPLKPSLESRAKELGIAEKVTFVGACSPAQLGDWYRAADLTVLPSRSEGLPNVLRESIACGTPFVASDVGGISEIAGVNDRLAPPENPAALADAVIAALKSTDARAARRLPTWSDSADAMAGILASLRTPAMTPPSLVPAPEKLPVELAGGCR